MHLRKQKTANLFKVSRFAFLLKYLDQFFITPSSAIYYSPSVYFHDRLRYKRPNHYYKTHCLYLLQVSQQINENRWC